MHRQQMTFFDLPTTASYLRAVEFSETRLLNSWCIYLLILRAELAVAGQGGPDIFDWKRLPFAVGTGFFTQRLMRFSGFVLLGFVLSMMHARVDGTARHGNGDAFTTDDTTDMIRDNVFSSTACLAVSRLVF